MVSGNLTILLQRIKTDLMSEDTKQNKTQPTQMDERRKHK